MTVRHHDHPGSPDTVHPEDLDLYALDALDQEEADAVEQALVAATPDQRSSMLAHIRSTREVVADLVAELRARGEGHDLAFADLDSLRVALDQELSDFGAPLAGVREVAFFPPMTGG